MRAGSTWRCSTAAPSSNLGGIATCDAPLVGALLSQREHTLKRARIYGDMRRVPGSDGVLFMDGEEWRRNVQPAMPVLVPAHVQTLAAPIHAAAARHEAAWRRAGTVPDLYAALCELGLDVILDVGFGVDPASDEGRAFAAALAGFKRETLRPEARRRADEFGPGWRKARLLPWLLATAWRLWWSDRRLQGIVARIRDASRGGVGWLRTHGAAQPSVRELSNRLNHLYGAFNAIDFVLTAALSELGRRPLWAEACAPSWTAPWPTGPTPAATTWARLPQLSAFLREVLRAYPVTMTFFRQSGAPLVVEGANLPAGTQFTVLLYALHHHPDYWDDPLSFRPERWLAPTPPHADWAYVPYLEGPRQCIGHHLAELVQATVVRGGPFAVEAPGPRLTQFAVPRFDGPVAARFAPRY